jgi:hypothetical protein
MTPKPDFVKVIHACCGSEVIRNACDEMYAQGAVVCEAEFIPSKGVPAYEVRGWKKYPYG